MSIQFTPSSLCMCLCHSVDWTYFSQLGFVPVAWCTLPTVKRKKASPYFLPHYVADWWLHQLPRLILNTAKKGTGKCFHDKLVNKCLRAAFLPLSWLCQNAYIYTWKGNNVSGVISVISRNIMRASAQLFSVRPNWASLVRSVLKNNWQMSSYIRAPPCRCAIAPPLCRPVWIQERLQPAAAVSGCWASAAHGQSPRTDSHRDRQESRPHGASRPTEGNPGNYFLSKYFTLSPYLQCFLSFFLSFFTSGD